LRRVTTGIKPGYRLQRFVRLCALVSILARWKINTEAFDPRPACLWIPWLAGH